MGIPSEQIQRIIPVTRAQTKVFETENEDAFISIPALFHKKGAATVRPFGPFADRMDSMGANAPGVVHAAPHALVLKSKSAAFNWTGSTMLLSPKIDVELEIPEEKIRALPKAFAGLFSFFRGACFADGSYNMIFILDLEKLITNSITES